eukprot:5883468-Pleurochrysis_carterae.AAC.1
MPNEAVIQHRIVRWQAVYEDEYVVDFEWWGTSKKVLSKSRWTELRDDALAVLSVEYFGTEADGVTPKALLQLKERPNHSNF